MSLENRIQQHFRQSGQLKLDLADFLSTPITQAAEMIVDALLHEKKVLTCGNGGSAASAQYFASLMLNRYELERPGLAAIALCADNSTLTSIAIDSQFERVFSQQILALGLPNDILLVISTSGNSKNTLNAVTAAKERGMSVIAMSGGDGGLLMELLEADDIHIGVPHEHPSRIQEVHLLTLHSLCDAIDCLLLGVQ